MYNIDPRLINQLIVDTRLSQQYLKGVEEQLLYLAKVNGHNPNNPYNPINPHNPNDNSWWEKAKGIGKKILPYVPSVSPGATVMKYLLGPLSGKTAGPEQTQLYNPATGEPYPKPYPVPYGPYPIEKPTPTPTPTTTGGGGGPFYPPAAR